MSEIYACDYIKETGLDKKKYSFSFYHAYIDLFWLTSPGYAQNQIIQWVIQVTILRGFADIRRH